MTLILIISPLNQLVRKEFKAMRKIFVYVSSVLCLALIVSCAISVKADNSRYVISAKAGGVSMVSGQVTITRKNTKSAVALTAKDQIEAGDIVTTASDGRAEITLNPGSYLRIGENSSFEFTTTILEDLRLKLLKGSAVFEATGGEYLAIRIEVTTPQTVVSLVKKGIYRLNVTSDDTEIQVWKGEAQVGSGIALKVKSGKTLTIGSSDAGIAKLDKKDQDSLDLWSKSRAKFFADERDKLEKKDVRQAMSSFYGGYGRSLGGFPFYGAWLSNAGTFGCRYFIPFDPWAWSSPYGFNYFNAGFGWSFFSGLPFWGSYYCPYTCNSYATPIYTGVNNGNTNGSNTGNGNVTSKGNGIIRDSRGPSPRQIIDEPSIPTRPVDRSPSPPLSIPSGNSPTKTERPATTKIP